MQVFLYLKKKKNYFFFKNKNKSSKLSLQHFRLLEETLNVGVSVLAAGYVWIYSASFSKDSERPET